MKEVPRNNGEPDARYSLVKAARLVIAIDLESLGQGNYEGRR